MSQEVTKNLHRTTHTIHSTIDTILDKGASTLYNKYISNKIPQHLTTNLHHYIGTEMNPIVNSTHTV